MIPVEYVEMEEKYLFRHWINYNVSQRNDDMFMIQDINQWCGETFGELGIKWGYYRSANNMAPHGSVRRIFSSNLQIEYSWRFRDKEDAMLFKLTWGGS